MIKIRPNLEVNPNDILWIEGENNYSTIHYQYGKQQTFSVTLKCFEEKFNNDDFYRSHKNSLINIKYIESIDLNKKEIKIEEYKISIARRRLSGLISLARRRRK